MTSTVLRDWNLLSSVCELAQKEMGMMATNPFRGVKRPTAFKTRPPRQVPLSRKAVEILGEPAEGEVFGLSAARLDINWRNLCKAAAVHDLNFHDSRHYAATWLSKKLDPLALAKMLGHRDLQMLLNVYYKADAASLVDKLD